MAMTLLARPNPNLFLKSECQKPSKHMVLVSGGGYFARLDFREVCSTGLCLLLLRKIRVFGSKLQTC